MRTVVFLLDDLNLHSIDFSDPTIGNPGVGGTEYLFVALAYELAARHLANVVLIHRNGTNEFPTAITSIQVSDFRRGLRGAFAGIARPDAVIVRGHDSIEQSEVLDSIPPGVPVVAWTHNYLRYSTASFLARAKQVKQVVYVGREQFALSSSLPCHFKSSYIMNGFYMPEMTSGIEKTPNAVYVGSIVPSKGFHRLAKLWPEIVERCPNARLDVIGSGRVHDSRGALGRLGLAAPAYEEMVLRYLHSDPAKYNVTFHGKLGVEKFAVMQRATVGLPNPTGYTECCPGSVLELSACGTAVVAPNRWGMCDTVVDGKTGRLCRRESEYVKATAALLADSDMARQMGDAGREFVRNTFDFGAVTAQWTGLIEGLHSPRTARSIATPKIQGSYPFQMLRRTTTHLQSKPLVAGLTILDRAHGWLIKNR